MTLSFSIATDADALSIATLRSAAAQHLTSRHGEGHWSHAVSETGVRRGLKQSRVLVAHGERGVVGTLRLATKKPWAIDPAYFVAVQRPLYLVDMAVEPNIQRQGIGRRLIEEATAIARAWPANAIRLDAYDAPAGAAGFYASCGFTEKGRVVYRGVPLVYFERLIAGS